MFPLFFSSLDDLTVLVSFLIAVTKYLWETPFRRKGLFLVNFFFLAIMVWWGGDGRGGHSHHSSQEGEGKEGMEGREGRIEGKEKRESEGSQPILAGFLFKLMPPTFITRLLPLLSPLWESPRKHTQPTSSIQLSVKLNHAVDCLLTTVYSGM